MREHHGRDLIIQDPYWGYHDPCLGYIGLVVHVREGSPNWVEVTMLNLVTGKADAYVKPRHESVIVTRAT